MKVLFSLLIHEKVDIVINQIGNINKFVENPIIILHISGSSKITASSREKLANISNVFINHTSLPTKWGNIVHAHISNISYALSKFEFDYLMFTSSNDMFIRQGVEKYIDKYQFGHNDVISKNWPYIESAKSDKYLLMKGVEKIYISQIEGSFYNREIISLIYDKLIDYDFSNIDILYPREEVYFSTFLYQIIQKDIPKGFPVTFSDVYFTKELFHSYNLIDKSKLMFKKLLKRILLIFNVRKDFDIISKSFLKEIVLYDKKQKTKFDFLELYDSKNIYAIKRVARSKDSRLRRYINNNL